MLTVAQISNILDVTTRQVQKYIENGHLKATKKENVYYITIKSFDDFKKNYYQNRHKGKGKKIPTETHLQTLKEFIEDIEDENMCFDNFSKKYKNINFLIPPIDHFLSFKRNNTIVFDRVHKNITYCELKKKYGLSIRSIEEIVSKSKQGSI